MSHPQSHCDGEAVCNAESDLIPRSSVLALVRRHASTVKYLQSVSGLAADHPKKSGRERWEITQGKLLVCEDLIRLVSLIDPVPVPRGEKTHLSYLRARQSELSAEHSDLLPCATDVRNPRWESDFSRLQMVRASLHELSLAIENFSGSAGAQPETREDGAGVIGEKPCDTPAPESFVTHDFSGLSDSALAALSEACLDALEMRGNPHLWRTAVDGENGSGLGLRQSSEGSADPFALSE